MKVECDTTWLSPESGIVLLKKKSSQVSIAWVNRLEFGFMEAKTVNVESGKWKARGGAGVQLNANQDGWPDWILVV